MKRLKNIIIKIKKIFSKKSKPKLDYHDSFCKDYWLPIRPNDSKAFNRKIKIDNIYKLNKTCATGTIYNNISIGKWNVTFGSKHKKRIEKINKIYR